MAVSDYSPEEQQRIDRAVAAMDIIGGEDPEWAHGLADTLLLLMVAPEIKAAYIRLQERCSWWASA